MSRIAAALVAALIVLVVPGCFDDTGNGDDSSNTGDGDGDGDGDLSCDVYCSSIGDVCTGANQQYASEAVCLAVCGFFDPGMEADQTGDTLGCRLHYTVEATEAPDDFCGNAGPTGDGVCGTPCSTFCELQEVVCVDGNDAYGTVQECLMACEGFDASVPFNSMTSSGDTFACRFYHLTAAAQNPDVHCPHVLPNSPVCI